MLGRSDGPGFVITEVDQNGGASGTTTGLDVPPPITNHVARRQIDPKTMRGLQQHARLGLATWATVMGIIADLDGVEAEPGSEVAVDAFNLSNILRTASDIGLIGAADEEKPRILQKPGRCRNVVGYDDLANRRRRVGPAIPDKRGVEHSVTVEEDRPSGGHGAAPSHFV